MTKKSRSAQSAEDQTFPDTDHVLAWWRTHPPYDVSARIDDLRNALILLTRGLVDDEVLNEVHIYSARAKASFSISAMLSELDATSDLILSWLSLSGLYGDHLACRIVSDALIDRGLDLIGESELDTGHPSFFELAFDWKLHVGIRWKAGLRGILQARGREVFTEKIGGITKELEDERDEVPKGQIIGRYGLPFLTPVSEIGDRTSREGKEAVTRYGRLTAPLKLAGGRLDPDLLGRALGMEFSWLQSAIDAVVGDLRLQRRAGVPWMRFRPVLLVGPPGVGKTRFVERLGLITGTGCETISAAGSADNRLLSGTARGWTSGQPAFPLLAMLRNNAANPVIVVDEVDKTDPGGQNGDLRATLLSMLEHQTASAWFDEYLLAPCDLSQVSWALTANEVSGISAPLLSRLRVIHVDGPGPEHFESLFNGVIRDIADELKVPAGVLPDLEPESIECLRQQFKRKASVRGLKAAIISALAHTADPARRRLLN